MKLILKNFRCYTDKEFDFGKNGLLLLSGPSGIGKSTILMAINFVLYGTGTKLVTYGKSSCKVCLYFEGMNIVRTKRPNRLVVDDIYEDASAQSIIDKKFGKTFNVTAYISQNAANSFVMMSPLDKLAFLERFAFADIDLGQLKFKCKAIIKKRNEQLIATTSQLEMATQVLKEMQKPTEVKYPLKPTKNKEKAMTNETIRLKNTETLIKRVNKYINNLQQELNALNILNAKIKTKTETLDSVLVQIDELEFEKQTITYDGDETLKKHEDQLTIIMSQRELELLENRYEDDQNRLKEMIETEIEDTKKNIDHITEQMWKEYSKDEIDETINSFKQLSKDSKTLDSLRERLRGCEIDENELEKHNDDLQKYETELESKKNILVKLKLQQELYSCPTCDQTLRFDNNNLTAVEDDVTIPDNISGDIESTQQRIDLLTTKVYNLNKKISYMQSQMDRHKELTLKIEGIVSQYDDEIPPPKDVDDDLQYLKDYKHSQHELEKRIKKLQKSIDEEKYSTVIVNFKDSLKAQKKRIKSLKKQTNYNSLTEEDTHRNEEDLRSYIDLQRRNKDKLSSIEKQLNRLYQDKSLYQSQILNDKEEHISSYKTIRDVSSVEKLIDKRQKELNSLENKRNLHVSNVEKIEEYKKYIDNKTHYEEWEQKVIEYRNKEEQDRKKYAAATLLKEKILEAESIAMINVINSINTHVQEYLDLFFTNDPITARLLPYKESKKSTRKPQVNIQIEYKGMEADLSMLSGGELSRVVLAFTLGLGEIFNTPLMLLDECTASLDQELTTQVIDGIRENYTDKMVIIIAHQVVSGHFDRVINL